MLRFDDGKRIPYGVPEFLSEEEAEDFQAHVQGELSEGAATYFATCCQGVQKRLAGEEGDDEDDDVEAEQSRGQERDISFADKPTARVRRLEAYANYLRKVGLQSLERKAARRQAELEAASQTAALSPTHWYLNEQRNLIERKRPDKTPEQDRGGPELGY